MAIYIVNVLCIIMLRILSRRIKNGKKYYCIIIGALLTLTMGLRSIQMGQYDVEFNYAPMFERLATLSFSEVLKRYPSDSCFYFFSKVISLLFGNVHAWLLLISIIVVAPITILIYQKSNSVSLSFILYLTLNYYGFSFTLLRQSIAVSIVVLAFLQYEKENRRWAYILTAIACGFHITAIVFVAFCFLKNMKIGKKQLFAVAIAYVISVAFSNEVITRIFQVFTAERFTRYLETKTVTQFNHTIFFVALCLFVAASFPVWLSNKKTMQELVAKSGLTHLYNIAIINLCILSLITTWDLMFRVAMYYGIFTIVYIPNIISEGKSRFVKSGCYYGIFVCCLIYYFCFALDNAGVVPYLSFLAD